MKTYTGTKIVKAKSMSRAEYNNLRQWALPSDENGDDEGYLVEYTDGGRPNHPDFSGYISWSPKRQFEAAYIEIGDVDRMPAYIVRVKSEQVELDSKLSKLEEFIQSNSHFKLLTANEQDLLHAQCKIMTEYLKVLNQRLSSFQ